MIVGFFLIPSIPLAPTDKAPALERGMEGERQSLLSEEEREHEVE